jgi:phage terminase large subunit-like protein
MPRVLATTTPRLTPLMERMMQGAKRGKVVLATGRTTDNRSILPADYLASMIEQFESSAFGRQELDGELMTDREGAMWTRALLERCRCGPVVPMAKRTVVAVDPPASSGGDACGIVVAMLGEDGNAYVRADCSVSGASPERWARAVAGAASAWGADRVVVEKNQGGEMVRSVLQAADEVLPVKLVHAIKGKTARAEPVAALYENGKVRHAGMFKALEDQLCGMMAAGRYEGPGRSPDRADALVWALTELMLGVQAEPKVRVL